MDNKSDEHEEDEVSQPLPSPSNSEDFDSSGLINTDADIGLQDFKLDESFLDQFDPGVQSKLKLITAAHENAKKYLDLTVRALNNQKQYLKYMSDQNRDFQIKLENLEAELKREQSLKHKAESDLTLWKGECQKAEVTYNKIKSRKKTVQASLAKMYDKYDVLMAENHSLRRLVENLSTSVDDKRIEGLPARKPKQATQRLSQADTSRSDSSTLKLPPITRTAQLRGQSRSKRSGQQNLPPITQPRDSGTSHGDFDQSSSYSMPLMPSSLLRTPTPWHKDKDANNSNVSMARPYQQMFRF